MRYRRIIGIAIQFLLYIKFRAVIGHYYFYSIRDARNTLELLYRCVTLSQENRDLMRLIAYNRMTI